MAVGGPVHLVLDGDEEPLRGLDARVVVDAGGVDVEDLAVKDLLGGADVPDPREELVEVVGGAGAGRVLEALVVEDEALDDELAEVGGRPLAELDAARGAHAVADGEDHRQAVVLEDALDPPGALLANL